MTRASIQGIPLAAGAIPSRYAVTKHLICYHERSTHIHITSTDCYRQATTTCVITCTIIQGVPLTCDAVPSCYAIGSHFARCAEAAAHIYIASTYPYCLDRIAITVS